MRNVFGWSVLSVVLCTSVVLAQQPRQPNVRPGNQATGGVAGGQQGHGDHDIAQLIVGMNRNEVEIAKFAMDRLQSSQAKEIATMLIKDHSEAINKFSRFAGQGNSTTPTDARTNAAGSRDADSGRTEGRRDENRREEGRREEGNREDRRDDQKSAANPTTAPNNPGNATSGNTGTAAARPNNNAGAGNTGVANPNAGNTGRTVAAGEQPTQARTALKPVAGGNLDWNSIHQEIGAEELAQCKKELARYEGNEFDKAFLGDQIAGHLKASAKLRVLKKHASSELASQIDGAISTTESHLKHIRSVMEEKKEEKSDSKKRSE